MAEGFSVNDDGCCSGVGVGEEKGDLGLGFLQAARLFNNESKNGMSKR